MFALHTSAGQWYWPQNSIWYLHRLEYTILEMILLTEETDYIYINIVRNSKVCHLKIQYCFMLIEMQLMVFNWTMNKEKDSNGNENKIILAIKMTIENMLTHRWTISSFTVLQLIEANNKENIKALHHERNPPTTNRFASKSQYLSEIKYCSIQSWPHGGLSSLLMVPTTRNLTAPPTPTMA